MVSLLSWYRRPSRAVLLVLILAGTVLRFYALNWDNGINAHSDERNVLSSVRNVGFYDEFGTFSLSNLNPEFFAYGGFPVYINRLLLEWNGFARGQTLIAGLLLLIVTILVAGLAMAPRPEEPGHDALPPPLRNLLAKLPDIGPMVWTGLLMGLGALWYLAFNQDAIGYPPLVLRSLSALAGSLTLLVVFAIGRMLHSESAGILATAVLAFLPLHIQQSHYGTVDIFLTFLTALCMWSSLEALRRPTLGRIALAGGLVGCCMGTKTSGVMASLAVALAVMASHWPVDSWRKAGNALGKLVVSGLVALMCWFATSPFTFLEWEEFQKRMDYEGKVVLGIFMPTYTVQFYGGRPFETTIENLVHYGMGTPLGLLALFASVYALGMAVLGKRMGLIQLFSYFIPYFLTIGTWKVQFIRYQVPLLPFYAVFVGYVVVRLAQMNRPMRFAVGGVAGLVLAHTTLYGIAYAKLLGEPHTRYAASQWIHEKVPQGSVILHEGPWDEALPLALPGYRSNFRMLSSLDDFTKLSHVVVDRIDNNSVTDDRTIPYLSARIAESDYIILSSKRILGGLMNIPKHYPVSANFYRLLFSGALGYELERTFSNHPSLLGFTWETDLAEESWQTNDHPKVYVFRRVEALPLSIISGLLRRLPPEHEGMSDGALRNLILQRSDRHAREQLSPLKRPRLLAIAQSVAPDMPRQNLAGYTREVMLAMEAEDFAPLQIDVNQYKDREAIANELRGKPLQQVGLNEPRDIDIGPRNQLYIADFRNYRVLVVDAQGNVINSVGGAKGGDPGYFNDPCGIAADRAGNIIVGDTWNWRIQKFNAEGRFQWEVNDLFAPRAVATDVLGNIYVVETGHCQIRVYTPSGRQLLLWGSRGEGPGQFQEPIGITVSRQGEVFVCDTWNRRVQVFTTEGVYKREFPVEAWNGEHWREPYIDMLGDDRIVITDPPTNRVLQYTIDGAFLGEVPMPTRDGSSLNLPMGIATSPSGEVYVADTFNNRILKAQVPQ